MNKFNVFLVLFIGLISNNVFAGAEFDQYLAEKIFNDCQGNNIIIKEGIWYNTATGEPASEDERTMKYPYRLADIKYFINLLTTNEPYLLYGKGGSWGLGMDGRNILTCGDKSLTINFTTYYWGDERQDIGFVKNEVQNYASNIITEKFNQIGIAGSSNTINTGDNSFNTKIENIESKVDNTNAKLENVIQGNENIGNKVEKIESAFISLGSVKLTLFEVSLIGIGISIFAFKSFKKWTNKRKRKEKKN